MPKMKHVMDERGSHCEVDKDHVRQRRKGPRMFKMSRDEVSARRLGFSLLRTVYKLNRLLYLVDQRRNDKLLVEVDRQRSPTVTKVHVTVYGKSLLLKEKKG